MQKAVKDRGGISKLRCLSALKEPQIEIAVSISHYSSDNELWKYSIGIMQESRGHRNPYLIHEKVWKNKDLILERPDPKDEKDRLRLSQTHLEQINANFGFREISDYFNSICYMHLIPQLLRDPSIFIGGKTKEDYYGRAFLEKVASTPVRSRKRRLKKIEEALRIAVPQLKELTDTRDENGIPHLEAMYKHWRPNAGKQSEDQFSDGTLRLIGLLWNLLDTDSLLLVEEPELSLHAGLVRRLPGLIWRLQNKRKRQIIISTHSADLLSDPGIGGEDVLMFNPSAEGTKIESASQIGEIRLLLESGFSISEAALPRTEPIEINQLSLFNG